jgi:hypothetical protein
MAFRFRRGFKTEAEGHALELRGELNLADQMLTTTPANLAGKAKFKVQTIFSRWDSLND